MYLPACVYVCLGYHLHTYVPKYRAVHPSIHPSVLLSFRQTDCLSTCMSVYRSIWPPIAAVLQAGGAQDITFSGSQRHSFNHLVGYVDDRLVRPRAPTFTIHHRQTSVSIHVHIYVSTFLPTTYLSTSTILPTYLPAGPFVSLSPCLFVHPSIHPSSIYSVVYRFCSQDVLLVRWNFKVHSRSYEEISLPALLEPYETTAPSYLTYLLLISSLTRVQWRVGEREVLKRNISVFVLSFSNFGPYRGDR